MAVKNYYLVLGVSRGESAAGIRSAYREIAKRLHPDRAGENGTRAFQELAEAYEVLSDPKRRLAHNRALDEEAVRTGRRGHAVAPFFVEPLVPNARADELRARASWIGSPARLDLVVTLSSHEAAGGGGVPLRVPFHRRCASCRGSLWDRLLCLSCGGSGVERIVMPLAIPFPAGVRSGTVLEAALPPDGRVLRLTLYVRPTG